MGKELVAVLKDEFEGWIAVSNRCRGKHARDLQRCTADPARRLTNVARIGLRTAFHRLAR